MKIKGIEHIGIAVDSLTNGKKFWSMVLGLKKIGEEEVIEQGVDTDIYDIINGKIELLKGTSYSSPISKFIRKKGKGIHHICLKVENIEDAIIELKENKVKLIGDTYTIGAEGLKVIFIHPSSTGGVLVELAEVND